MQIYSYGIHDSIMIIEVVTWVHFPHAFGDDFARRGWAPYVCLPVPQYCIIIIMVLRYYYYYYFRTQGLIWGPPIIPV